MYEPIVNSASLASKVAYQYSESTNFLKYLEVLVSPFDELEEVFADILNYRNITTASTHALDVIGTLVGQTRETYNTAEFKFFSLDPTNSLTSGLGDLDDPTAGGIFRSLGQSTGEISKLQNPEYKKLISGKEYRNNFKGGTENLIACISDVLNIYEKGSFHVEEVFTDPTDPFVRITFYVQLTLIQQQYLQVLGILPKPAGIRYEYIFV